MDLDLSALETGKQSTSRSSQFNPRLKPRARPRRATPSTEASHGEGSPKTAADELPTQPSGEQEQQQTADVVAAPADGAAAPTAARATPAQAAQEAAAQQPPTRPVEQPAQPSSTAAPNTAPLHGAERAENDGQAPVSPSGRRVRFAPAAVAARRARQRQQLGQQQQQQQQPDSVPSEPPAASRSTRAAAAAAASETPDAEAESEGEGHWPDATPALPPICLPAATPRGGGENGAQGQASGKGRPPGRASSAPARTVASQRREAAAAAAPSAGSAAAPAPGSHARSGAQKRVPLPLPLLMLPPAQRHRGGGRGRPAMLPTNLNPSRMALKDVIRWSNDKERETLLADKLRKEARDRRQQAIEGGQAPPPLALPRPRVQSPQAPSPAANMAPQVSIVDGQIVVDRATLTVQAQAEDMQRTIVEDTQQLNSRSYAVNRTPSERWQPEETENFFRALATFGSDFTLIATLFPNKNRRQIKNKYSKESKANSGRVDDALKGRACSSTAYDDVLNRINFEGDDTTMLELDEPPAAD